jgi:hypothetical protein
LFLWSFCVEWVWIGSTNEFKVCDQGSRFSSNNAKATSTAQHKAQESTDLWKLRADLTATGSSQAEGRGTSSIEGLEDFKYLACLNVYCV